MKPARVGHRRGVDLGGLQVTERRPVGTMWTRLGVPAQLAGPGVLTASGWGRRAVSVLSALEVADYPRGGGAGPQWHISVAGGRGEGMVRRPTDAELRMALVAFGMAGAEEDNHHPGNARHFWMPLDPTRRVTCECKGDERTVVEPDGYQWTTPHEGPCRGCELAALELGRTCPLHPTAAAGAEVAP